MKNTLKTTITAILLSPVFLSAQVNEVSKLDATYLNWYNQDLKTTKNLGVSVDKTYQELIGNKKAKKTIIVAVIDNGVDVNHKDLKGKIWVNENEIPNNRIDDDNNGYIDDVNGWSFLGNSKGENIEQENLEFTRIVRRGDKKTELYKKAKEKLDEELGHFEMELLRMEKLDSTFKAVRKIITDKTGNKAKSIGDLNQVLSQDVNVVNAKNFLMRNYKRGLNEDRINNYITYIKSQTDYYLNVNFEPRKTIGDNPIDITDTNYGNPDVAGPNSGHGTMVSGVIAANRNNNIGNNGIATNVKIMALRAVPDGDERDKDVALAIIYAVNNGASVINMSFGKDFSPEKHLVDSAIAYAEKNNVLLINAAGNDNKNVDTHKSYPTHIYNNGKPATNMISVGATTNTKNKKAVAVFSNYGKNNVHLFAPGYNIISLDTNNTFNMHDGTSFAAPVVSGVAALLLSYYPNLTPQQVISILKESSYKLTKPKKVYQPSDERKKPKVRFSSLSQCGGIVNAYNAFILAESMK